MGKKQQMQKKTPEQQQYEQLQQKHEIKRPILKNCRKAFLCWWNYLCSWTSNYLLLYLLF